MAIMPKNSSFSDSAGVNSLTAGDIVMYENDNSPLLACIIEFKKSKYFLLNQRGREVDLPSNRLYAFNFKIPVNITSSSDKTKFLSELFETCRVSSAEVSIDDIWEQTQSESRDFTCRELLGIYSSSANANDHIAFRLALLNDKIYFKRKNTTFEPRSAEIVSQLKKSELERQKKLEIEKKSYEVFFQKISNPALIIPDEMLPLIHNMEKIAAETSNIDASVIREVRDYLHSFCEKYGVHLSGSNHERVYNFLCQIHHFDNFTNLSPIRHKLQEGHRSEIIEIAEKLDITSLPFSKERNDLTRLDCFTIDDSSTKDMDDALSLEYTQDGFKLGIHISDVASAIEPYSELDKMAAHRLTSLYFPDRVICMLPEALSNNKISLVRGEKRPALSFLFTVSRNYEITAHEIVLSNIIVKNRYDYEMVNDLLEDPQQNVFEVLHNIAVTHETKRIENGAIQLHKKEVYIIIKDKDNLALQEIDEASPSRKLISELMVIANSYLAKYANENKIPFIFRTQEKPEKNSHTDNKRSSESPSGDLASRMVLKKSLNTTTPKPHAGLGLNLYCQATSPIRRYLDLINQRQVVGFLQEHKPVYADKELRKILHESDENLQKYTVINRESKRFWILKYLEMHVFRKRNNLSCDLHGTVVRTDMKIPLVELDEVFIAVPVKLSGKFSAGDNLKLRITSINPAFDHIKLEAV